VKPCSLCGTLTTLYEAGTPICLECLAQREAEEKKKKGPGSTSEPKSAAGDLGKAKERSA